MSLSPIASRPENLTEQVFQRIQESIIDQTLDPGMRVSEASIAALLNVSKTPVREALLRLKHLGLVEQSLTGRLRVFNPSSASVRDAYEFRAMLERGAAHDAALRITPDGGEQLLDYANDTLIMAKAQTGKGYRDTDRRFHLAVAMATTNTVLHTAIDNALILTSALRERDLPMADDFVACAQEHIEIAEAIAGGQATSAAKAMEHHILHVMAQVLHTDSDPHPSSPAKALKVPGVV